MKGITCISSLTPNGYNLTLVWLGHLQNTLPAFFIHKKFQFAGMCDPVIDEHFRRSLGKDYMSLFSSDSSTTNSSNNSSNNSNGSSSITVTGLSGKKSSASLYCVYLLYIQSDSLDRVPGLITVNHTLIYHLKRNWQLCILCNTDPVSFCLIYAISFCL